MADAVLTVRYVLVTVWVVKPPVNSATTVWDPALAPAPEVTEFVELVVLPPLASVVPPQVVLLVPL